MFMTKIRDFFRVKRSVTGPLLLGSAVVAMALLVPASIVTKIWFFELLASFIPQFLLLGIVLLLASLLLGVMLKRKAKKMGMVLAAVVVSAAIIGYSALIIYPVAVAQPDQSTIPTTPVLRVAFFNKSMLNTDLNQISEGIAKINPEIIGFAEISDGERQHIPVLAEYPYFFITKCGDCKYKNTETAIFSKYPIEDPKKMTPPDGEPLVHAVVQYGNYAFRFLVIHPHSPVTPEQFAQRNKDLVYIADLVNQQPAGNLIVMGDFNTAPWSPQLRKFTQITTERIKNAEQGTGLQFTWGKGPVVTDIDHIFVSNNMFVHRFVAEDHFGSDHRLIYADIQP
jgi:endonuclease/exonuclease/phosphatase (EEP) superfamily protein YafD